MSHRIDPEGLRLPIKLDTTSNGEFAPVPLEPVHLAANRQALEDATRNARRLGMDRRSFLVSLTGAATTLLAMNRAYAQAGKSGGCYALPDAAALEEAAASEVLAGKEFIFDVQGHFVNPTGAWTATVPPKVKPLSFADTEGCAAAALPGRLDHLQCLGPDAFIRDVFTDSDTDLCVLSFVPSTREAEPLTIAEAAATAAIVEQLDGTHRLFLHGRVNPNQAGDLEAIEEIACQYRLSAFKTYTQWGPDGKGYFLDDEVGLAMIEAARNHGVRNIAVHKGLPFGKQSYEHSTCVDVGRVAKRNPDMNFLIYHSGFVTEKGEGAYDPQRSDGVDQLISSVRQADLGARSNVYAELGSTWRFLMRDPDAAAHTIGKLLLHLGEDNILWGTARYIMAITCRETNSHAANETSAHQAPSGLARSGNRRLRSSAFRRALRCSMPSSSSARSALSRGGRSLTCGCTSPRQPETRRGRWLGWDANRSVGRRHDRQRVVIELDS